MNHHAERESDKSMHRSSLHFGGFRVGCFVWELWLLKECGFLSTHSVVSLVSFCMSIMRRFVLKFARKDAKKPRGLRKRSDPQKKLFARSMRRSPTKSEAILWSQLRQRKCMGYRFHRQAVILGWIVDFWCPELRLVIEVDGSSHKGRHKEDARRDSVMVNAGISIIRISASFVESQPDTAMRKIRRGISLIANR